MRTKNWLRVALVPASLLALYSPAAAINCNTLTVTCNTFLKGGAKFKPVFTAGAIGTCAAGAGTETISIKGTASDCTVTGALPAAVPKIISGSVKGTLYTGDCTCGGLVNPAGSFIKSPPVGKTNSLAVSWKLDPLGPQCDEKAASTLVLVPNVAKVAAGSFIAAAANANFNPSAVYGAFTLKAPGVGVTGAFAGPNLGITSSTTGATSESVPKLLGDCTGAKGLKGITFGQADLKLGSPSGAFLE